MYTYYNMKLILDEDWKEPFEHYDRDRIMMSSTSVGQLAPISICPGDLAILWTSVLMCGSSRLLWFASFLCPIALLWNTKHDDDYYYCRYNRILYIRLRDVSPTETRMDGRARATKYLFFGEPQPHTSTLSNLYGMPQWMTCWNESSTWMDGFLGSLPALMPLG